MLKITDKQKQTAQELGRKHKASAMWVNAKGEFFTRQDWAKASVGGDADKIAKVEVTAEVKKATVTNDLDTATEVLKQIEAADTKEAVLAIQTAEQEGKNRVTVLSACEKKLASFQTQD